MKINPPTVKFILFSGGGGLAIREQTVKVTTGINFFEIQQVPASFDPDTTTVEIETAERENIKLLQISVKQPDAKTVTMEIDREKNASESIISSSTDLRSESREEIISICESAYYRQYEDMFGEINISIESKIESEIKIIIQYIIVDKRIIWKPSLQIDLNDNTKKAKIIGYLNVVNNSAFNYPNVEIQFAEFEMAPAVNLDDQLESNARMSYAEQQDIPMSQLQQKQNLLFNIRKARRVIK